jgi:hypothetical protein
MSKRRKWSLSVGKRPHTVTVYERVPGGVLYARAWDPTLRNRRGGLRRISLGHRDKGAAKAYAAEQHAKLIRGDAELVSRRISLGRLLALYGAHRTPQKGRTEQKADQRRMGLYARFLGPEKDPLKITWAELHRFVDARRTGELTARGRWITDPSRRKPVRDRTIESDLKWLNAVMNWGMHWQDREGRYLLRENPIRGFPIPRERNPQRPVMTEDRYEALRAVSDEVTMEVHQRGHRVAVRSHLSELLDLANETGRRISAILGLRYQDLELARTSTAPHGAISWPADTDKQGRTWRNVPLSSIARNAIDRVLRDRPGIGEAPLFPAPGNPSKPVDRYLADQWLRDAETLAGLQPQIGGLWHPFRRKAATELKGAPDKDVMALMGWTDLRSLKTAYQHADPASMLTALEQRRELRGIAR